ncbi:MAG: glycosyl hydrolase [bacterium]
MKIIYSKAMICTAAAIIFIMSGSSCDVINKKKTDFWLKSGFLAPPDSTRPGVYWYFLEGNLNREELTADLASMKEAGIGFALFQEVRNEPRGKVNFLSEEWKALFKHAVREGERLGIRIILGSSPGWTGSGGPWIRTEQSMQFLVVSFTETNGPATFQAILSEPGPKKPYRNPTGMSERIKNDRDTWYEDVAVLAFPTPPGGQLIESVDDKALYHRGYYTWVPGVHPYIIAPASYLETPGSVINTADIINLSDRLQEDGSLQWEVPAGKWTILRFGRRSNGIYTVPSPIPGLGLECNKFDTTALNIHFDSYMGELIRKVEPRKVASGGGMDDASHR